MVDVWWQDEPNPKRKRLRLTRSFDIPETPEYPLPTRSRRPSQRYTYDVITRSSSFSLSSYNDSMHVAASSPVSSGSYGESTSLMGPLSEEPTQDQSSIVSRQSRGVQSNRHSTTETGDSSASSSSSPSSQTQTDTFRSTRRMIQRRSVRKLNSKGANAKNTTSLITLDTDHQVNQGPTYKSISFLLAKGSPYHSTIQASSCKNLSSSSVLCTPTHQFYCSICFNDTLGARICLGHIPECQHTFCFKCIRHWAKISNCCPLCKTRFHLIEHYRLIANCTQVKNDAMKNLVVPDRDTSNNTDLSNDGYTCALCGDGIRSGEVKRCRNCSNSYHAVCHGDCECCEFCILS